MTEHRIELMQFMHTPSNLIDRDAELVGQLVLLRVIGWQKFVQRRIEKTNRGWQPFQGCEDANEIAALIGK